MVSIISLKKEINLSKLIVLIGRILFLSGLLIFFLTFYRIIWQETKYAFRTGFSRKTPTIIKPISTDFGIVIPKIGANAKVIDNVDPFNSREYQLALTKGVAHAIGTAYPGHVGNDFIFAHSSENWYIANQFNSIFYLLHKLEKDDLIEMYYKKKKYVYKVFDKKYVYANAVEYLNSINLGSGNPTPTKNTSILTLMTCWPPGTTFKRLIIRAEISN